MSTSSPRKSTDSLDSLQSPLSPSQRNAYPFADSNRYRPRRTSTASSVVSINSVANSVGGSLDIHGPRIDTSVKEAGQNAISSLLQPPIIRTGLLTPAAAAPSTFRPPSTRDIPPVTLTNIPHVDPSAFNDYLSRIGPLFDSFQRARAEEIASSKESDQQRPALSREGSTVSLLSPVDSPQPRRRSSAYTRRRLNEPTPLSTIPPVYFDENFQLENPRTFDVVSEHAEIVKPPSEATASDQNGATSARRPPRKSLATNAILQEKLSWYMDTVEVHLINSISSASTSFFQALGSLKDLEHEAADSVTRIQKLRGDLAKLDQEMAMGGLEVANLRRRHDNVCRLARAVDQVARVVEDAKYCEDLVEQGHYDAASDAMIKLGKLMAGEAEQDSNHLIDLRSLKALQAMSDGLNNLHLRISRGFETRFLEALLSDLRQHVEKVPPNHTLRRWASTFQRARGEARIQSAPPAYLDSNSQLRENLLASLSGLSGSGQTARATTAFREAVMKEMKTLIRKHLPSSSDDDVESVTSVSTRGGKQLSQQEKSAILARNLRALDEDSAEELFVKVYTGISEALRRLSIQIKVLLDVTSTVDVPQSPARTSGQAPEGQRSRSRSLQEEVTQALDLSSLLGQAVEIAQTQITRVLKVRTEQSVRLPLDRFVRYFTLNRMFADECEAISGHSGTALKSVISTQLTAFVHSRSETENQAIAQKLDSEQWEAKDFTERHQAVLSRILQGMTSDPPVWLQGTRIWENLPFEESNDESATNGSAANINTNGTSTPTLENPGPNKPQTRPAYIDDNRYILVSSAMSLLGPIEEFLALIASVPSIGPVAVQAYADYLRTFNSRTSQLVLGAGATRIAGLKNITTKHLALSSQALSFVIALTPYMREAVRRHIGGGAGKAETLAEFDKVKRTFQDHQMGIHDKLVEIMTTRATAHVNAMKKIDFDNARTTAPDSATGSSPYMETLTKETATLYRVLNRHLAEPDVNGILAQIFNGYKNTWTRAFAEAEVKTVEGKERLLKDAETFDARLNKINGFGEIGKTVVDTVKAKSVVVTATAGAAAATTTTSTTATAAVDKPSLPVVEDGKETRSAGGVGGGGGATDDDPTTEQGEEEGDEEKKEKEKEKKTDFT